MVQLSCDTRKKVEELILVEVENCRLIRDCVYVNEAASPIDAMWFIRCVLGYSG